MEAIIARYIKMIPQSSSAIPYLIKDLEWDDDKSKKKMKNALSKHGIAFDYAFEKIFAKYEEIDRMEINKGELVLYGRFSERKDDFNDPSIDNIYYNLYILKGR